MTEQHDHGSGPGGHDEHGSMGVHGMLLFGGDVLYLSHLPMFQHPHNFQVILQVEFDEVAGKSLRADRANDDNDLYTFEPVEFHITELDPSGDGPARSSIEGTVYRGHFERGGQPIFRGAVANVSRVVYFSKLDFHADHTVNSDLTYLCFGGVEQLHLVHLITSSPNFDHVLTARRVPGTLTSQTGHPAPDVTNEITSAVPVEFRGRSDTPHARLTPKEVVEALFFQSISPGIGFHGFRVQLEIDREIYVELSELGST
ncbi:hypothetical protein ACX80N_17010 [Arthrobacter sp. MDT2-16]